MIGRIMSSVIGARVVLGLAIAGLAGTVVMGWAWMEARGSAEEWKADAENQRVRANHNADRAAEIADERDRLDRILTDQRRRQRQRREQLGVRLGELRDALQGDECAGAVIPDAARRRVFAVQAPDGDGSGDDSGGGSE